MISETLFWRQSKIEFMSKTIHGDSEEDLMSNQIACYRVTFRSPKSAFP